MKEEIQNLIAAGRTEEALALLVKTNGDAVLLQARYSNGKKQYTNGLIDFGEWQRIQNGVNYAALEMAGSAGSGSVSTATAPSMPTVTPASPTAAGSPSVSVFISYNHADELVAQRVTQFLEAANVDVLIDRDDMEAGESIMAFIQRCIKKADAVLSIVSAKSLSSGWVGQESVATMYAVWLADKKFIPVRLDDVSFDIDFQIEAQKMLATKIKDLKSKITQLEKLGGASNAFRADLDRLNDLKNNLGKIIERFNSVLTLDIREPLFDSNMKRVLNSLQKP